MLKLLTALLLTLFCVPTSAQNNVLVLNAYPTGGRTLQFDVDGLDTLRFSANGDTLTLCTKEGNQWKLATGKLDSLTITTCDAANVHEAVDLGLSAMWATCNVGASKPEEWGDLYAWGETSTKDNYSESTYEYYQNQQYEYIGVNICGTKYDAARQQWGTEWRLPTRSEVSELITRCQWTAETRNGVAGYRVTANNGNSIFLPCCGLQTGTERTNTDTGGFYWTGSLDRTTPSSAYNLNFRGYDAEWTASRAYGMALRPVK